MGLIDDRGITGRETSPKAISSPFGDQTAQSTTCSLSATSRLCVAVIGVNLRLITSSLDEKDPILRYLKQSALDHIEYAVQYAFERTDP